MNAKVLVVYHKKAKPIKNSVLTPIHVGDMANKPDRDFLMQNMIGDDTGENISHKNSVYNELTAIYWAWKNYDQLGNPDYIGLCHYRRYFILEQRNKPYYEAQEINNDFLQSIRFSDKNLEDLLKQGDFIAPMPIKTSSVRDHYRRAHNLEDLLRAERILLDKYPEYAEAAARYLNGAKSYFYNMFVFDKATFFRYCNWIFDILSEYEKTAAEPLSRMFISERLTGIFFTKLIDEGKKGVHLPTLFLPDKKPTLKVAIARTKSNLKAKNSSILYAFKPLILYFIPSFIIRVKRERRSK